MNRGFQFSDTQSTELLQKLEETTRTLVELDRLGRGVSSPGSSAQLSDASADERARLRKQAFDLATDLRAEMRRRDGL